jgi:hypothetical protein
VTGQFAPQFALLELVPFLDALLLSIEAAGGGVRAGVVNAERILDSDSSVSHTYEHQAGAA